MRVRLLGHTKQPTTMILTAALVVSGAFSLGSNPVSAQVGAIDFDNVASRMDVGQWNRTFGSYWTDYDLDGDVDFFLSRHQYFGWFFAKRPGRFERVTDEDLNEFMDRHGCAWGQANLDRWPDLYCTQGADMGSGTGPNQLLVRTRDGFVDRTSAFGVANPRGRGRSANWLDYDGDLDLDLFVNNTHRRDEPSVMFENRAGEAFERVRVGLEHEFGTVHSAWADWDGDDDPDVIVLRPRNHPIAYENVNGLFEKRATFDSFGDRWSSAVWSDYNGDGWVDLHLTRRKRSLVLQNQEGVFLPVHETDLELGRASAWFDVENDGDLDLFVVQGATGGSDNRVNQPDLLLINKGGAFSVFGGRAVRGAKAGDGESVAIADFNRDGLQDAFVTNGQARISGPNVLLQNESSGANWLGLDLQGPRRNPMGFGSSIHVEAGALSYERYVNDGVGARAQSEAGYVHLGLGTATSATVEVSWPDGTRDCFTFQANRVVTVRRDSSPCT